MNYLLKIYHKSKYFGFKKYEYIEFESYCEIMIYVNDKNLKYENYEIYAKVVL